jgi:hypothetical protein
MSTSASSSTPALEPGAIAGPLPATALPAQNVSGPAPWGDLDASVAPNFVSASPILISAGTVLRRVFGYPDSADPWPSWETGSWWTRQPLPATEAAWRAGYAVEAQWNGGQCVVAWTIPADLHGWAGPAAPQAGEYADGSPAPSCYLAGGAEQIYIAAAQQPIGTFTPGSTPWTPPSASASAATAAPPTATPAAPTLTTLGTALTHLSGTLGTMATEAKGKGLDAGAIRFQARQVSRMSERLAHLGGAEKSAHRGAVLRNLTGLARHIHTQHAWSAHAAEATTALKQVVVQADTLARAERK